MKIRSHIDAPGWSRGRALQDLLVLGGAFLAFLWIAYEFTLFGAVAGPSLDPRKRIDFYEAVTAGGLLFCGIWVFALRRVAELRAEALLRAEAEARATEADFRANHDPLTGLGNRAKFDASLGELTTRPTDHEPRPRSAALLLLDLNGFKQVNDQFGHPTGDEVLQIIARRLQSHSRHQDQLCRIGGDEFAILAKKSAAASTDTPISAEAIAAKIIGTIGTPILIEGRTIEVGVAIGIAYFPDTAKTGRDLMAKADLALYAAKENNRMSARSSYVVSS